MRSVDKLHLMFALALLGAGAERSVAQEVYPTKAIRFIVPFAPGGGTDLVARIVAHRLNESLGQSVIVDNRPGAGSTIGTAIAVKAPADGYTMLLSSISLAFNASLYKSLPFDPMRDLAPVTLVAVQPNMLVTNPQLPVKSVGELVALARKKPASIRFASGGNGSGPHLATELLEMSAGIDLTHIPYKGTGPALTDLLAGQIDMMIAVMASALPHVKAGKLRALAVTAENRSKVAPDIPTIAESGIRNYAFETWYGIQVPRGTPSQVVGILNTKVAEVLARPDVRARFSAAGLDVLTSSPEEFAAFINAEIRKWAKVVEASGARIQ